MSDKHSDSGSNAGVVILIAVLVLAIPCCGGVALFGLGMISYRSHAQPAPVKMAAPPVAPIPMEVIPSEAMPPAEAPEDVPAEAPMSEDSSDPPVDSDPALDTK